MRRLRVAADYFASPVWDVDDGGMVDLATLPIAPELVARLQSWADTFDATMDHDDPLASGFASPAAEVEFRELGRQLARSLQAQLGAGYEVVFSGDE